MNKQELIAHVAEATDTKKNKMEEIVNTLFTTIEEAVANGEKVMIAGYLKLEVKDVPARVCRNPKTGETVNVPAHKKVVAKAMKKLQDAVN